MQFLDVFNITSKKDKKNDLPTSISFIEGTLIFPLLLDHIQKNIKDDKLERFDAVEMKNSKNIISLKISFGEYMFSGFNGEVMAAEYKSVVQPLAKMKVLTIFGESQDKLMTFFNELSQRKEIQKYTYNSHRWRAEPLNYRLITSVFLPETITSKVVGDIEDFQSVATQEFYKEHEIPYTKSYLFYGVEGSGKYMHLFAEALACKFQRNIFYYRGGYDLDNEIFSELPENSILLYDNDRVMPYAQRLHQFMFPHGTIVIVMVLEKNENVYQKVKFDLAIRFSYPTVEQIENMWSYYYPAHISMAKEFSNKLSKHLSNRGSKLTLMELEKIFLTQKNIPPEKFLVKLPTILDIFKDSDRDQNRFGYKYNSMLPPPDIPFYTLTKERKSDSQESSEDDSEEESSDIFPPLSFLFQDQVIKSFSDFEMQWGRMKVAMAERNQKILSSLIRLKKSKQKSEVILKIHSKRLLRAAKLEKNRIWKGSKMLICDADYMERVMENYEVTEFEVTDEITNEPEGADTEITEDDNLKSRWERNDSCIRTIMQLLELTSDFTLADVEIICAELIFFHTEVEYLLGNFHISNKWEQFDREFLLFPQLPLQSKKEYIRKFIYRVSQEARNLVDHVNTNMENRMFLHSYLNYIKFWLN